MPALPPIFVINLARSTTRRERLEAQAATLELPFTFFPASDGTTLSEAELARSDPAATRRLYGRALKPGELGCYWSHLRLWERIVEEQLPWAVVLEDDPLLDGTFLPAVRAVAETKAPWELIRLAGFMHRRAQVIERLSDGRELIRTERGVNGSNAYAITLSGARRLLEYSKVLVHPVDNAIDRVFEHHLELFAVRPFPVRQDDSHGSTIVAAGASRRHRPERLAERLAVRTRRLADSLHRRWYNLRRFGLL